MRRAFMAAGLALSLGAFMLPANAAWAAPSDVFRGSWTSFDSGDGSAQTMDIRGSGARGHHSVFVHDTVASRACDGAPANVKGAGTVDEGVLVWFFTVTCPGSGKGPVTGRVGPGLLFYNAGTDTITDDSGTVWHRVS